MTWTIKHLLFFIPVATASLFGSQLKAVEIPSPPPDSLEYRSEGDSLYTQLPPDSLFSLLTADSIALKTHPDSLTIRKKPTRKSDVDTTITADAKVIRSKIEEEKTYFVGDAVIKYKNMTLTAAIITLDWKNRLIIAEPQPDTVWVKNEAGDDSTMRIELTGEPVLVDAGTKMVGEKMVYNYETEKGRVVRGRTQFEDGYYIGEQMKKVDKETFNISHSTFTTCELDSNPHYHFSARRLKLIVNDKIIAKPIILYLGKIPIAALPFGIFPNKTGRQSGLIIPRYGESTQEGRYLRGLGYYWAPSDYFDARGMVDFFEKTGWLFHGGANYAVRYRMNGSIDGSLTRKNFSTGYKSRRWDLRINHRQELDPTSRFSISGFFVSDKNYYRNTSPNLNTRLKRELRSNATYSKSWSKQKLSLSVNLSQVHDLQDDVTQETFPQITFRKGQVQIFPPKEPEKGRRSRSQRRKPEAKWYHSLYYSYNSTLFNSRREYLVRSLNDTTKEVTTNRYIKHRVALSLTSPKKYFGWLSLNQTLDTSEDWFDKTKKFEWDAETGQIIEDEHQGFAARHTFSYNASANTKLYGMVTPNVFNIQAIRHVVTPSLSFQFAPDFSDPEWGYYIVIEDTTGKTYKKDRFGGTPQGGTRSINLSIRNLFQMKKGSGENEKKIDLFNMDMRTGYNLEAEQYRLSDLRTSWQANPAQNFSLSANTTHSFYAWDLTTKQRVHRYLFQDGGWKSAEFMRLTTFQINFSIRLQKKGGNKSTRRASGMDAFEDEINLLENEPLNVLEDEIVTEQDRFEPDRTFRSLSIPWRMNLRFNFLLDKRRDPDNPEKTYYLDISGAEINLTNRWRIGYNAHYDLEKGTISHHRLTVYRDLHCWEANIDWVPSGINKRVYFRINIKSPNLRDIKLEKGGGKSSMVGYY